MCWPARGPHLTCCRCRPALFPAPLSPADRPCHYLGIDRANQCIVISIRCVCLSVCVAAAVVSTVCLLQPAFFRKLQTADRAPRDLPWSLRTTDLPRAAPLPPRYRGSLQVGDLLSDLAAAPMEVKLAGADGWVHQVRRRGEANEAWCSVARGLQRRHCGGSCFPPSLRPHRASWARQPLCTATRRRPWRRRHAAAPAGRSSSQGTA